MLEFVGGYQAYSIPWLLLAGAHFRAACSALQPCTLLLGYKTPAAVNYMFFGQPLHRMSLQGQLCEYTHARQPYICVQLSRGPRAYAQMWHRSGACQPMAKTRHKCQ